MLLPLLFALAPSQKADGPELTSGRPVPPEQSCYDVEKYTIKIRVDPETRSIQGETEISAKLLRGTDDIVLDLDSRLEVREVLVGRVLPFDVEPGEPAEFSHRDGELRIHAPKIFQDRKRVHALVTVRYGGKPREAPRPPWDGGFVWSNTKDGSPWIATANQMQGADLWFPCKDQPDDEAWQVVLYVAVPSPLVVASNGRFSGLIEGDLFTAGSRPGWQTYVWHVTTPINTYGIALNIAPYETITRDYTSVAGDTFPVTYWVLPENLAKGKVLFEDILRQMAFFEATFGPYPFRADKYGVAETPHLGMEHQSIIAYGNEYKLDRWGEDRGYDELHLHEFAHEWWANLVTAANWNDFWLHEGFASYAQALYAEHVVGRSAYLTEMREQWSLANSAAIAPREPRSTAQMYFGDRAGSPGGDIYYKGSWVLHTLRWVVGDEAFLRIVRRMAYPDPALEKTTDGSACRFATTDELVKLAEEISGRELDWFFETYVRQAALPELETRVDGGKLVLEWKGKEPFPMPVPVRLGDATVRVECPDGKGRLDLGRAEHAVDPENLVLRAGLFDRKRGSRR